MVKRKHSRIEDSQATTSKRSRISQDLWSSQSAVNSSSNCSVRSSGILYDIKGIIQEAEHHYLIDWADDPVTGRSYERSWISISRVFEYFDHSRGCLLIACFFP